MRIVVTGSSGHLGEALVRVLCSKGHQVVGLDLVASPWTEVVGSITDRGRVRECVRDADAVIHAATLHKPHLGTHSYQDFLDTNLIGTLSLLEESVGAGVGTFLYTSTTSAFGRALEPALSAPAAWITEQVAPIPKNIYGVTKAVAEDLCQLFARERDLACIVLRTSRFFPEPDDDPEVQRSFPDANVKANELLFRRVDIEDVVEAHVAALDRAPMVGFGRYIVSATSPFSRDDLVELRRDAPAVVRRIFPDFEEIYEPHGWHMFSSIGRVYVNERARHELGWRPRYDFRLALDHLSAGQDLRSPLAIEIGQKGYHESSVPPYTTKP
jgi:nucleoside-diphosphate-sugar epimerase